MTLTFWITAALACLVQMAAGTGSRKTGYLFFLCMGLGFLAKRPMAWVVPGIAALVWTWVARVVFTVGALWFLATKLNWQEFSGVIRQANPGWLLAALAAYGGVVLVSIVRWHLLLEVAGAAVGWGRTAQLAVAGLFFNSILPGVMGGDVMRAFWAARDAPQARPAAVVSILLERVLGLAANRQKRLRAACLLGIPHALFRVRFP
jgi:4-amino-4-deoxy-L-arabinose transferase-like glycosyltransferase